MWSYPPDTYSHGYGTYVQSYTVHNPVAYEQQMVGMVPMLVPRQQLPPQLPPPLHRPSIMMPIPSAAPVLHHLQPHQQYHQQQYNSMMPLQQIPHQTSYHHHASATMQPSHFLTADQQPHGKWYLLTYFLFHSIYDDPYIRVALFVICRGEWHIRTSFKGFFLG